MNALFQKTAKGQAEVTAPTMKLSLRLRTMLILIDGAASTDDLQQKAAAVSAPTDFLEQLRGAGLIAEYSPVAQGPEGEAALAFGI